MRTRDNISASPPISSQLDWWARLSQLTLSVETIRQIDQVAVERYGMHSLVLMENAAIGCAAWLRQRYPERPHTLILCGRGNNGGDGLAIARHLRIGGWSVDVVVLGPVSALSADALANWRILTAQPQHYCHLVNQPGTSAVHVDAPGPVDVEAYIGRAGLVIDAMLGSGARGTPRAPLANWIEWSNRHRCERIAIDIPSGLDATTGQPAEITFRASTTLTFVARKPGFASPAARQWLGDVEVLPIGIPIELMAEVCATGQSVS